MSLTIPDAALIKMAVLTTLWTAQHFYEQLNITQAIEA